MLRKLAGTSRMPLRFPRSGGGGEWRCLASRVSLVDGSCL